MPRRVRFSTSSQPRSGTSLGRVACRPRPFSVSSRARTSVAITTLRVPPSSLRVSLAGPSLDVLGRGLRLLLHLLRGLGGGFLDLLRAVPSALLQVVLDLAPRFERLVLERLDALLDRAGGALFGLSGREQR